jgi:methionyl-tRNA formyltransferase
LPEHDFRVFWSGELGSKAALHPALDELAAGDRAMFASLIRDPKTSRQLRDAIALAAPNEPEGLRVLSEEEPALVVSIRYRRILREQAIAVPTHGVINLHSGILPDYRGVMATFWAMLNGEIEIGSTLHRIVDAGIDTGPVIGVDRRAVDYQKSYLANVLALYQNGCETLVDVVNRLSSGKETRANQQQIGHGRYYSGPQASDVTAFLAKGMALISKSDVDTPLDALMTKMNSLRWSVM